MNNEYAFLKATKPPVSKSVGRSVKVQWHGLNMNAHADSGYIVDGENFYVTADGTLRAVDVPKLFDGAHTGTPLALCGIDGKLFYVYCREYTEDNKTKYNVDIIRYDDLSDSGNLEVANLTNDSKRFDVERSLARYNVWTGGSDIVSGTYKPRLLVYPDKQWLDFNGQWYTPTDIIRYVIMKVETENKTVIQEFYYNQKDSSAQVSADGDWFVDVNGEYTLANKPSSTGRSYPKSSKEEIYAYSDDGDMAVPDEETRDGSETVTYTVSETPIDNVMVKMLMVEKTSIKYVTSYHLRELPGSVAPDADFIAPWNNRIFGVNGTKIFASAAGSYVDYDLDTATDFDENNAWYSATQSGGDFTHICTYGGRPVAFKADMLYELYNDKNPFRIKEISRIGAFNGDSVHEVNSSLFYANKDGIYAYGGSYPRSVSDGFIDKAILNTGKFTKCAAGSHEGKYFVRVPRIASKDSVTVNFKTENGEVSHSFKFPFLVFDTSVGAWSSMAVFENDISYFAECDGKFFAVLNNGKIYIINSGSKFETRWFFETPVITDGNADRKVLEKLQMLIKFHGEGSVKVSVKYDNGAYEDIGIIEKQSGVHPLYCKVRKSDHVVRYIRFDCVGDVELLTFEQFLSAGGDR